jgi:hypothetical protein
MLLNVYHNNISTSSSIIYSLDIKSCYIRILPTGMFPVSVVSVWFPTCMSVQKTQQNGQCTYNVTLRHVCITIVTVGNYSGCVSVALVIQHAKHMHSVILSSVVCPPPPYFSTLCQMANFQKKSCWTYNVCVLIFSTDFVRNISHSKKNSARYYHKCI